MNIWRGDIESLFNQSEALAVVDAWEDFERLLLDGERLLGWGTSLPGFEELSIIIDVFRQVVEQENIGR